MYSTLSVCVCVCRTVFAVRWSVLIESFHFDLFISVSLSAAAVHSNSVFFPTQTQMTVRSWMSKSSHINNVFRCSVSRHRSRSSTCGHSENSIIFIWRSFRTLCADHIMAAMRWHMGMGHMKMALIYLIAYWFYCVSLHLGFSSHSYPKKSSRSLALCPFDRKTKCIFNIMWCERHVCQSLVVNSSATKLLHRQPHSYYCSYRIPARRFVFLPDFIFMTTKHFTIVRSLCSLAHLFRHSFRKMETFAGLRFPRASVAGASAVKYG